MNLLIAIPTMDTVPVEFMKSLLALTQHLSEIDVEYDVAIESGTLVYMARDRLASKALTGDYTHILWLDSDMVFEPCIVEDLQFCGKDFVSGIAHSRRSPFVSCLFKNINLSDLKRWTLREYPADTFEVAGCGFACVLISAEIVRAVLKKYGTGFTPFQSYGEDLSFCKRAADLGFKIYAEPTVRLGHIAHIAIWPDDIERYADDIQRN